jgi:hypothetical protein
LAALAQLLADMAVLGLPMTGTNTSVPRTELIELGNVCGYPLFQGLL